MTRTLPGFHPSRSRALARGNHACVVAVAENRDAPMYEQAAQAFADAQNSLQKLDFAKDDIVAVNVFLSDMQGKAEMNRAWQEWMSGMAHPPVRACLGAELEPGYLIEVVVTALKAD